MWDAELYRTRDLGGQGRTFLRGGYLEFGGHHVSSSPESWRGCCPRTGPDRNTGCVYDDRYTMLVGKTPFQEKSVEGIYE